VYQTYIRVTRDQCCLQLLFQKENRIYALLLVGYMWRQALWGLALLHVTAAHGGMSAATRTASVTPMYCLYYGPYIYSVDIYIIVVKIHRLTASCLDQSPYKEIYWPQ